MLLRLIRKRPVRVSTAIRQLTQKPLHKGMMTAVPAAAPSAAGSTVIGIRITCLVGDWRVPGRLNVGFGKSARRSINVPCGLRGLNERLSSALFLLLRNPDFKHLPLYRGKPAAERSL